MSEKVVSSYYVGSLLWMPGLLGSISTDFTQYMMCAISMIHYVPKVVLCFRHITPSHYHHNAVLLTSIEHIR